MELREVVDGRKMEDAVCYPPFAVARLQCHAFVNPTRVLAFRGIEREPSDPLSVEAAEADKKVGLAQRVNPPALKDAGALIPQNESPEAHAAGAIAEDGVHRPHAILLAITDKTVACQSHHPVPIGASQPQVAALIFTQRSDVVIVQAIFWCVQAIMSGFRVAFGNEFK